MVLLATNPPRGVRAAPEDIEVDWSHPHADGLVAWWPGVGRYASPTHFFDVAGGYHASSMSSGLARTAINDVGDSGVFFDVNNKATVSHDTALNPASISVVAWAIPAQQATSSYGVLAGKLNTTWSSGYYNWQIKYRSGSGYNNFDVRIGGGGTQNGVLSASDSVNYGEPCQVALTFDDPSNSLRGYSDGVEFGNASYTGVRTDFGAPVTIGDDTDLVSSFNSPDGPVWNVRIYNRALYAEEIMDMYREPWALAAPKAPIFFLEPSVGGTYPHGPMGHPLHGALGGPI